MSSSSGRELLATPDRAERSSGDDLARVAAAANDVIDGRKIQTLFQPLVHLATAEVVGYEALTRGPAGSPVESPLGLLEAARAVGRLTELDWACAAAACEAATQASLHPSMTVFLNFEPSTLLTPPPNDLRGLTRRAQDRLRVVVEMKEESLVENPARLFQALACVRETGWGVAIDNAAASPTSLALLPLVHPDVIKLDLRGLRGDLARVAAMGDGVRGYAEQTGATILAQGLEDVEDLLVAKTAGATFGQGWYFGRPASLPTERAVPRSVFPLLTVPSTESATTPFEVVCDQRPTAVTEKRLLVPLSHYLESQASENGPPAFLLIAFQLGYNVSAGTRRRLDRLMSSSAFTAVIGSHLGDLDEPNSRTSEIDPEDPIRDDWTVIVLGARYAGALVARDLGDSGPDASRRFEYAVTHDRELVSRAARVFLHRITDRAMVRGGQARTAR